MIRRNPRQQSRQHLGRIAAVKLNGTSTEFGSGVHELLVTIHVLGPDQRAQPPHLILIVEIDGVEVDTVTARYRNRVRQRRQSVSADKVGVQHNRRVVGTPAQRLLPGAKVAIAVAVESQVQPRACAHVDQRQRRPRLAVDDSEGRQQAGTSAHNVGLRTAVTEQWDDLFAMSEAEIPKQRKCRVRRPFGPRHDRIVRRQRMRDALQQQVLHGREEHVRLRLIGLRERRDVEQVVVQGDSVRQLRVHRRCQIRRFDPPEAMKQGRTAGAALGGRRHADPGAARSFQA